MKKIKEGMSLRGVITIEHKDKDGNLKKKETIKNTITNTGLAVIAGLAGNVDSQTAFTYLAVGTGTTASAATDTALEAEIVDSGLARSAATVTRETTTQTNDTLQLTKTWTVSGAKAVTETGIFNDATTGTMLGHQVFSAYNVVSGDSFGITYQIIFA